MLWHSSDSAEEVSSAGAFLGEQEVAEGPRRRGSLPQDLGSLHSETSQEDSFESGIGLHYAGSRELSLGSSIHHIQHSQHSSNASNSHISANLSNNINNNNNGSGNSNGNCSSHHSFHAHKNTSHPSPCMSTSCSACGDNNIGGGNSHTHGNAVSSALRNLSFVSAAQCGSQSRGGQSHASETSADERVRFKRKTSVYLENNTMALFEEEENADHPVDGPCGCLEETFSRPAAMVLVSIWFVLSCIFYIKLRRSMKGFSGGGDVVAQTGVHFLTSGIIMLLHSTIMWTTGQQKHEALSKLLKETPAPVWLVLGFAHFLGHALLICGLSVLTVSNMQLARLIEPAIAVAMAGLGWVPQSHAPLTSTQMAFGAVLAGGGLLAALPSHEVFSGVVLIYLSSFLLQWRGHAVRRMMQTVHVDACFVAFGITAVVGSFIAMLVLLLLYTTGLSVFSGSVNLETGLYYFGANAVSLLLTQVYHHGAHEGLKLLKRVLTAAIAAYIQYEHITQSQWIGVAVVAIGWVGLDMDRQIANSRRSRILGVLVALLLLAVISLGGSLQEQYGPETWLQQRSTKPFAPGVSEDGRTEEARPFCEIYEDQLYSIWAYPYGPDPSVTRRCPTEVVYCAYTECLNHFAGARRLNLASLAKGTPYEDFVRYHMWYKIKHKRQFVHHVQSVAMLSLLLKKPGICVRIIGDMRWHCHEDRNWPSLDYDPESGVTLPHFMPHRPVILHDEFTSFSYVSRMKRVVGVDLGDELQAFAGLSFVPYLTHFTDRDQGLPNSHGHIFMNSWFGPSVRWPPSNALNPVMVSLHTSPKFRRTLQAQNFTYLRRYNTIYGAIGAREHATLDFLRANGVDAYFSGCFSTIVDITKDATTRLRNKTFLVDVARLELVPKEIRDVAERRTVLPQTRGLQDEESLHLNAFELLRTFATEARLVVTSRIHVGLAAMSQGVPVVFLKPPPGAAATTTDVTGATGAGMNEVMTYFHVLSKDQPLRKNFNWSDPLPNPGNHIVDRHRASFWRVVSKRSHFYGDTAHLFGVVPLVRLGQGQKYANKVSHHTFHLALPHADAVTASTIQLAESVFRHHPNAKLVVHCNDFGVRHTDLVNFALVGYDVVVEPFDLVQQLRQFHLDHKLVRRFVKHIKTNPDDISILPVLALWLQGGVFLREHDSLITNTIPHSISAAYQPDYSILMFPKNSPILLRVAELFLRNPQLALDNALNQAINEISVITSPHHEAPFDRPLPLQQTLQVGVEDNDFENPENSLQQSEEKEQNEIVEFDDTILQQGSPVAPPADAPTFVSAPTSSGTVLPEGTKDHSRNFQIIRLSEGEYSTGPCVNSTIVCTNLFETSCLFCDSPWGPM